VANKFNFGLNGALEVEGHLPLRKEPLQTARGALSHLALADPSNAGWQRDLAVSHFKLATFARQSGDEAGFMTELRACFEVLQQMKRRNLHFEPQMAQVYQQLARMFGGQAPAA